MVVQHNLQSMNATRMLGITQGALSKSAEKLSSGYKVNRAADDAAGLSISEKMRKQIRGLDQASSNAEDGISAVQTAEGALTEVHDMLQRMNELAVKASNGTMSEDDRQTIQDEVDQLLTEIDRVADTTKFNETYLLKGNTSATTNVTLNAHDAGLKGKWTNPGDEVDSSKATAVFKAELGQIGDKVTIGGIEYDYVADANENVTENKLGKDKLKDKMIEALKTANGIGKGTGMDVTGDIDSGFTITKGKVQTNQSLTFSLHVGADADMTNKIGVTIDSLGTKGLGINGLDVKDATGEKSTYAIDAISDAVAKVSATRSRLGAIQNRLEHTIKNLDNIVENTTAAESQIRDTDMADEMVKYSNNNILAQAGQSMLAQANQSNQGVLSLLG